MKNMTRKKQRDKLVNEIKSAVYLNIHGNVCYLLNFCGLPQETADELSKHYNAIYKLIKEWQDNTEI